MNKRIVAILLFVFGILIGILTKFSLLTKIDLYFYNILMTFKCEYITNIFKIITVLGNTKFIIFLNIIIILYFIIFKERKFLIITFNSILSPLINNILKIIFRRERPDLSLRLINETNYSFPSGHAMISMFFYFTLIIIINRSSLKYKKLLNLIFMLIILLIGMSRIYLGVHYLSDILGGYLIALSIILFLDEGGLYESINNWSK